MAQLKPELTRAQERTRRAIDEISDLLRLTSHAAISQYPGDREGTSAALKRVLEQVVASEVISQYTFTDFLLSSEVSRFLAGGHRKKMPKRRRRILDDLLSRQYPLEKLKLIRSYRKVPNHVWNSVAALNELRNSVAHSFIVVKRQKNGLTFKGYDLRTRAGMEFFLGELFDVTKFLSPGVARALESL